jgi:hypothetical protein
MKSNREYKKCENCKEYHFSDRTCNPVYKVYYEEYTGDEPKEIRAVTFDDAACKFAEYYNTNCDYVLMGETIDIKIEFCGEIKFFKVGAEPDVHYSSEEL